MSLPHSLFLVIFGASGDLTRRKLMPALIKIHNGKRFPEHFAIIGCARTAYTDETYRAYLKEELIKFGFLTKEEMETLDDFLSTVHYQSMDPADETTYFLLNDRLKELSPQYENNGNYLFYLATPPLLYELIPKCLHDAGLLKKPGLKRIIVEKPFGYDLASAQKLNKIYAAYFKEEDIYRIDHFLGKETVQNIMVTRFGSTIYEPIWNRNYIDYVEITAVENMGIGTRGGYYDGAGALRDMVQNHLMQLLAITAMEPPAKFDKNGFRNEVIKVYQSLRPLTDKYIRDNVIRGQYIAGDDRIGYREEKNVRPDSRTDTYVAMCLYVDNWRWQGVPFYIRTGKQMPTKVTEIVVHFKPAPMQMFQMKEGFYKGDVCACCGTHVERCGQVGSIKLTSSQSYKGGTRVTMLCGMRAYEDHCIKFQNAEAVSGLLSAKINETAAAVQRLADENAALRAEKAALETRLFAADAAAFRGRKNALVFEPHLSPDSLRRLCTALMEQCTGVCAAFSGTDAGGYKYALGSAGGADVHALCKEMNAALGGRGGGREMQQGSAACTRGDIEAFFAPRLGE